MSGSFNPSSLRGLQLWLDATQLTGLSDGDPVETWSDLGPNVNSPSNTTPAQQPSYAMNGLGAGLPSVHFAPTGDPSNQQYLGYSPPAPGILPVSRHFTIFVVARNATNDVYDANGSIGPVEPIGPVITCLDDGSVGWWIGCGWNSPQSLVLGECILEATEAPLPSVVTQWTGGVDIMAMNCDGSTVTGWRNGVAVGSDTWEFFFASSNPYFLIGALGQTASAAWLGDMGEIIMYDRELTDLERDDVTSYLSSKWQASPVTTFDPASLLPNMRQFLIDNSVGRLPRDEADAPPIWLDPKKGIPYPGQSEGLGPNEQTTITDGIGGMVLAIVPATGIPSPPHEGFLVRLGATVWYRSMVSPAIQSMHETIRALLSDRRNYSMNGLQVNESLLTREIQRVTSNEEGYVYNCEYMFLLWGPDNVPANI